MIRHTFGPATSPGANSYVALYDDIGFDDAMSAAIARVVTTALVDQDFAIRTWWAKDKNPDSPLRLVETATYAAGVDSHVAPVRAARAVTVVAVASLANNDRFTLVLTETRDGVVVKTTTRTFEYKVDGAFTAGAGRFTIDVSELATDVEAAVATAARVVEVFGATVITCAVPTTAVLTPTSYVSGTAYVITGTETVTDAGFSIGAATVGVDGTVVSHSAMRLPGRTRIVIDTATAPGEFDVRTDAYDDAEPGV